MADIYKTKKIVNNIHYTHISIIIIYIILVFYEPPYYSVEEGSSLYSINHKHILSLIATTYDGSSPMMIYSYAYPGNLKKWLVSSHQSISTHQVPLYSQSKK